MLSLLIVPLMEKAQWSAEQFRVFTQEINGHLQATDGAQAL